MRSMTGFGQGAAESQRFRVTVTLRGVNHRYLDLVLRLREEYRAAEPALRELLTGALARGRVEAVVEVEPLGSQPIEVVVDENLAEALHELQRNLVERGLTHGGLTFTDLLRLPDVVKLQPREAQWTAEDHKTLLRAAKAALTQLLAARDTEGAKLREAFLPRLEALAELVGKLGARRAAIASETLTTLRGRLRELLEGESALTEDRLAQEAAILVDRSDVAEELDRLASHLEHFHTVMDGEGSLGKRLDFLSQEIFRELNTLGAKCRDSEMTRWVLDGKVLCEQIREQVQNVE